MSNFHPRRAARKAVLEALFAHQFTCDNPKKTLEGVIRTNQLKDNNLDFMDKLFHCVIENSDFSEKLIKSHLQNWELGRVAHVSYAPRRRPRASGEHVAQVSSRRRSL